MRGKSSIRLPDTIAAFLGQKIPRLVADRCSIRIWFPAYRTTPNNHISSQSSGIQPGCLFLVFPVIQPPAMQAWPLSRLPCDIVPQRRHRPCRNKSGPERSNAHVFIFRIRGRTGPLRRGYRSSRTLVPHARRQTGIG